MPAGPAPSLTELDGHNTFGQRNLDATTDPGVPESVEATTPDVHFSGASMPALGIGRWRRRLHTQALQLHHLAAYYLGNEPDTHTHGAAVGSERRGSLPPHLPRPAYRGRVRISGGASPEVLIPRPPFSFELFRLRTTFRKDRPSIGSARHAFGMRPRAKLGSHRRTPAPKKRGSRQRSEGPPHRGVRVITLQLSPVPSSRWVAQTTSSVAIRTTCFFSLMRSGAQLPARPSRPVQRRP